MTEKIKVNARLALLWINNNSGIIETSDGKKWCFEDNENGENIKTGDDQQSYITAYELAKQNAKETKILLCDIRKIEHNGIFYELSEKIA